MEPLWDVLEISKFSLMTCIPTPPHPRQGVVLRFLHQEVQGLGAEERGKRPLSPLVRQSPDISSCSSDTDMLTTDRV